MRVILCGVLGLVLALGGGGCGSGGFRSGQATTVFLIGSEVSGIGDIHNRACVWILGASGLARGMTVVIAQGDATLEECQQLHAPEVLAPPPAKKEP